MQNKDNIEKLFKDKFQNFEADVNPNIWTNVQSGISSGAGSAGATAAKFALGKIIAGIVAVGVIGGGIWYATTNKNENKNNSAPVSQNKTEVVSKPAEEKSIVVAENKSFNVSQQTEKKNSFVAHSENQQTNKTALEKPLSTSEEKTNASSDNSSADPSPAQHKYGPASKSAGIFVREAKNPPVKTSAQNIFSGAASDAEEKALPQANIFVSTSSGDAPLAVSFMNQGSVASLNWNFADGTSSNEISPQHFFEKAGTYEVILTAKNSNGTATAKKIIEVKQISSLGTIPNIFTPNGDGENDIFRFEMKNIASIAVVIMSREGNFVYQSNSLDASWNGKLPNGEDAPNGFYFYTISAIGTDGVVYNNQKGTVQLTRGH